MKKLARIGITLDLANNDGKYCYAARPWYALRKCYADAVISAGGIAIMLPYQDNFAEILDNIDGIIFSGGDGDIPPDFYGQEASSQYVKAKRARALFEIPLLQEALQRNMPILGICNGLQAINVALGGTLIQHIPDEVTSDIIHEQPIPKDMPSHIINIAKSSKLSRLAADIDIPVMVNSTHHQAIKDLGAGLMASARANDNIIEAIESIEHDWVIGVQWHCEYLNNELDRNLFKELVAKAAIKRKKNNYQ